MQRYLLVSAVVVTVALAGAAGVYYLSEARRLGVRVSHLEERTRTLEKELGDSLRERGELHRFLGDQVGELRTRREERERRAREAFRPMPEGVRLALATLNTCLDEDGFGEVGFLSAREIKDKEIIDVEVLEYNRSTLISRIYLAGRATLRLDRARGELSIRFFDGHRWRNGRREPFPSQGWALELEDVEGPMWEGRLGYLLHADGDYPAPESEPSGGQLESSNREVWLARLTALLRKAGTDVSYRVEEIEGLSGGVFTGVLVLGYQKGKALSVAIEAKRMSVVTDRRAATVELLLEEGVLRKSGGENRIGSAGYRILLPSVTREDAMEVMMGMVVQR